jgi:hypothetical protein
MPPPRNRTHIFTENGSDYTPQYTPKSPASTWVEKSHPSALTISNSQLLPTAPFLDDVIQLQKCTGEIELTDVTCECIQSRFLDMTGKNALQGPKRFFRITVAGQEQAPQSPNLA